MKIYFYKNTNFSYIWIYKYVLTICYTFLTFGLYEVVSIQLQRTEIYYSNKDSLSGTKKGQTYMSWEENLSWGKRSR